MRDKGQIGHLIFVIFVSIPFCGYILYKLLATVDFGLLARLILGVGLIAVLAYFIPWWTKKLIDFFE